MKGFMVSLLVIMAFAISTGGFGQVAARLIYRSAVAWPYAMVLGLGSWVLIGGLLNVSQSARPSMLYALFGSGLLCSLVLAYAAMQKQTQPWLITLRRALSQWQSARLIPVLMVVAVLVFVVATLLPAAVFNVGDDFHTYFVRPVRMLQTGTLAAGPFEPLGIDSLGAQSFLQAFVLLFAPLEYIDGVDAVFCFVLAALLLIELGRRLQAQWPFVAAALAVYVMIHPQDVNASALYAGSMTMLALIVASCMLLEGLETADVRSLVRRSIPVALFLACLIALKFTFLFFAAIYFLIYVIGALWISSHRTRTVAVMLTCALGVLLALLPWVGLNLDNYVAVLSSDSGLANAERSSGLGGWSIIDLFKPRQLRYGGSVLAYSYTVALIGAAGLCTLPLLARSAGTVRQYQAVPLLAACTAAIAGYLTFAWLVRPDAALRYAIPPLIAVLPASIIMLAARQPSRGRDGRVGIGTFSARRLATAFAAAQLVTVALFAGAFVERLHRAYTYRTTVSRTLTAEYLAFNATALSTATAQGLRQLQAQTERGESMLAWLSVPFHLNFTRNRILTVTRPGLITPWLDIRGVADTEARSYMARWRVRYVMWEYRGPGVRDEEELRQLSYSPHPSGRRVGETTLRFRNLLTSLQQDSKVIYDNGRFVLFDLGRGSNEEVFRDLSNRR